VQILGENFELIKKTWDERYQNRSKDYMIRDQFAFREIIAEIIAVQSS
jgi:hypothetical protein